MEWPYASLRRNRLPPDERAIGVAEYSFVDRPYGSHPDFAKYKRSSSYAGNTFTRNWVVNEKEHPTTGTPYAWVRARVLGGRTNFWGRGALRYGPLQFKAASLDGFDVDWPFSYEEVAPYYDRVDRTPRLFGDEGGACLRSPTASSNDRGKLNCVEVHFKRSIAKLGRPLHPRPRGSDH